MGNPNSDLAFLMLSCVDKTVREKHKKAVLEKYFFTFSETMRKLGCSLSALYPQFTFDDFRMDFEEALFGAFLQVGNECYAFVNAVNRNLPFSGNSCDDPGGQVP